MSEEPTANETRIRWLLNGTLLTLVVVIAVSWIWCLIYPRGCWFCPPPPDPPDCSDVECSEYDARIILEDAHAGVFMPINSELVDIPASERAEDQKDVNKNEVCSTSSSLDRSCNWPPRDEGDIVTGVLIQMGGVMGLQHFGGLRIYYSDGEEEIKNLDDFDWIDVNPLNTPCTIDPSNAYGLFAGKNPDLTYVAATACDDATVGTGYAETCLRGRALHALLTPTHALTYWPGSSTPYYGMFVTKGTRDEKFEFHLYDPVNVDVWNDGCLKGNYPETYQIDLIYDDDEFDHGALDQPPMDGR